MNGPSGPATPGLGGRLRAARSLLRGKQRRASGLFLVDGPQGVREALAAGRAEELFIASGTGEHRQATEPGTSADAVAGPPLRIQAKIAELTTAAHEAGVPVRVVSPAELAALSETVTPQGIVAVTRWAEPELATIVAARPGLVVVCAQVRDPGNAGAVIRCGDAFGADAVVLTAGSVDATNAKVVRASTGSLFHLPVITAVDLAEVTGSLRDAGLRVLAADGAGDHELDTLTGLDRPTAWVFGNEAWGLPAADRALADAVVRVPIRGAAESLNLATAAAVCLYVTSSVQQRRA